MHYISVSFFICAKDAGGASSVALLSVSRTAAAALPLVLVLFVVAYARIKQAEKRGLDT
jgi:hypothetical protein